MKPEYQAVVLTNYKLPELYSILADDQGYEKYIKDLFAVSNEYTNRAIALSALHTEAFLQSMKKKEEFDVVESMCQVYDKLPEADQKKFCEDMLQKQGVFEDAYKTMMDSFESAVEKQGDNVACSVVNEKVEK